MIEDFCRSVFAHVRVELALCVGSALVLALRWARNRFKKEPEIQIKQTGESKMLPIKDVVEVIQLAAGISKAIDAAKADGKIDLADAGHLFPVIPLLEPAITDVDQVLKQLGDVDDEEFKVLESELAKVGFIGNKAEILYGVKVHLLAAKANYEVFVFWKARQGA